MAGPNQPGKDWASWENYKPTSEDYIQRELDRDRSMYDIPLTDLSGEIARHQGLDKFLRAQITPNLPGGEDVRFQLLNNAPELIGGPTNFSQAPYEWFDPRAMMRSLTPEIKADPRMDMNTQGAVWPNKPDDIYINPNVDLVHTSSLLPHELGHSAQARYDLRQNAPQRKIVSGDRMTNVWKPMFSQDFMEDALAQFKTRKSPYYSKGGFGDPAYMDETLSYLMGREAELPAGKTLLDDPYSKDLFRRNPGSYAEYTKARDKLKAIYKETKRNAPR